MSLDQVLMIPGFRSSSSGGGGATFALTADNLVAGTPVLGTPTLTLNGAYSAFLPATSSTEAFIGGTRVLKNGYAGNLIKLRRGGDNLTTEIGSVNGVIDSSAIETWVSAGGGDGNGYVETIYDQSGLGNHVTQATLGTQLQIAEGGNVLTKTDGSGRVAIRQVTGTELAGTLASVLNLEDFSVFFECSNTDRNGEAPNGVFVPVDIGGTSGFSVRLDNGNSGRFYPAGNNYDLVESNNTIFSAVHYFRPNIYSCVVAPAGTARFYENNVLICDKTFTPGTTTSDQLKLGLSTQAGSGYITDVVIYTSALSDADRNAVYDSLNAYHQEGPITADLENHAVLHETRKWHSPMIAWMKSITTTDVDLTATRAALSWDGTYSDIDELFNLHLMMSQSSTEYEPSHALRGVKENFVLDDGNGGGITGSGEIRHYRNGSNHGSSAPNLAVWYQTSFPLSGGGNGNPYYQNSAVGLRALMLSAANLFGHDMLAIQSWGYNASVDFHGGALMGSAGAYRSCKDLLDATTQQAFVDAFQWYVEKLRAKGAHGVNSNMDCKAIAGICYVYEYLDTFHKNLAVEAVKRILFGSPTGTPETSIANGVGANYGIYGRFGSIIEGGSPETSYNGQSLKYLTQAYSAVLVENNFTEWNFLTTVLEGMAKWSTYQAVRDPLEATWENPSDYAARTGGGIWISDQGSNYKGRNAVLAMATSEGRPFARYKMSFPDAATMVTDIQTSIAGENNAGFADEMEILGTAAAHTNGVNTTGKTFLASTGTANLVITGTNDFAVDQRVLVYRQTAGTDVLPAELNDDTLYWITAVSGANISLSTTQGGAAIVYTTTGSGTLLFGAQVFLTNTPDISEVNIDAGQAWDLEIASGRHNVRLSDDSADWVAIRGQLNIASGSPVNYRLFRYMRTYVWDGAHWPDYYIWFPPAGTHTALKALVDGNDVTTLVPTERAASYSINVNDDIWFYRDHVGGFYWMFSAFQYPGQYDGFYSGQVSYFATDAQGAVMIGKHDKSGNEPIKNENTRVWSEHEHWATNHFWGVDASDNLFSTATTDDNQQGNQVYRTTTINENATPPNAECEIRIGGKAQPLNTRTGIKGFETLPEIASGTGAAHTNGVASKTLTLTNTPDLSGLDFTNKSYIVQLNGEYWYRVSAADDGADTITLDASEADQNIPSGSAVDYSFHLASIGDYFSGKIKVEPTQSPADGMRMTITAASPQNDKVKELWFVLPLLIRGQGDTTSGTVTYWNGGTWLPIPSAEVSGVEWIKCSRNGVDTFINFTTAQTIKANVSDYVQNYQEDTIIRNVFVSMHTAPEGTISLLPASKVVVIDFQTTDPGLTPTTPSVTVSHPVASTTLFTNGFWFAKADITFNSTNPVAKLQYSTDSTDGTDGTWSDVANMTLSTGTTYIYVGENVAIPSGLTYVRVQATDDAGTANVPVACSSTTPSLVVNDEFTDTNGTDLDGSYTGFTANATGNVYEQTDGVAEVQSNMAEMVTNGTWGAVVAIDCGSEDAIVQVDMIAMAGVGGEEQPGNGVYGRVSAYNLAQRLFIRNTTSGRLSRNSTTVQNLTFTTANGRDIQLTLQMIGNVSVGRIKDLTSGPTVLGYAVDWTSVTGSQKFGFSIDNTPGYQTFDNFKIWT